MHKSLLKNMALKAQEGAPSQVRAHLNRSGGDPGQKLALSRGLEGSSTRALLTTVGQTAGWGARGSRAHA